MTIWPRIIGLVGAGALPADTVVTATIQREQLMYGLEALLDPAGDALKIIVTI
ncbi:MAG TPA: hypothetical protein VF086_12220 [Propionibacteriaceae bacterium]